MNENVQDIETAHRLSEGLNILGEVRHKHAIRTCAEIRITLDQIIARDDLRHLHDEAKALRGRAEKVEIVVKAAKGKTEINEAVALAECLHRVIDCWDTLIQKT